MRIFIHELQRKRDVVDQFLQEMNLLVAEKTGLCCIKSHGTDTGRPVPDRDTGGRTVPRRAASFRYFSIRESDWISLQIVG